MWVHRLRGSMNCAGQIFTGLRGLRGSKYFLRGSTFYVGHNFYVGCMGQIYFCVGQFDYVRQHFICVRQNFLRGPIFFVVGLKNIDWCFHDNILVVHYIRIEDMLNQHPNSCNSSFTWFWLQYLAYFLSSTLCLSTNAPTKSKLK